MNERTVTLTLAQVAAAFDALLEVISRECDTETVRTAYFVRADVLTILSAGEWVDDQPPHETAQEKRHV